jgi:hypothetical protein
VPEFSGPGAFSITAHGSEDWPHTGNIQIPWSFTGWVLSNSLSRMTTVFTDFVNTLCTPSLPEVDPTIDFQRIVAMRGLFLSVDRPEFTLLRAQLDGAEVLIEPIEPGFDQIRLRDRRGVTSVQEDVFLVSCRCAEGAQQG